jgi:hypothetical protein
LRSLGPGQSLRDFRDDRVEIAPELARAVCVPNQSKHAARAIVAATGLPTLWTMHTSPTVEPYNPREQDSLARLEALAKLMDGAFVIPGTNIRMGLDGIIGLIPIAGDLVSGLISSYLIWEARQLGASRWVIGRMMTNTLIDTTIGAIPVLGDAFDVVFRNNLRNMALLRKHLARKGMAGPGTGPVIEGEAIRLS